MSDPTTRALVVLIVLGLALVAGVIARRVQRPPHPRVTIGDLGERPGVVLFTSTDCGTCKEAIALLEAEAVAFREVTYDLEPHRFEAWTVFAVPLTVVIAADGGVIETISGVPPLRRLRRAISAAGIERS